MTADARNSVQTSDAAAPESPGTVLLVDDEPNIITSLKRLFRRDNYRILTAQSGAEGLQILEQEPVDVIISDMRMPQMDGAAFLARVTEQWPDTMRMLLTGYADINATIAAINDGRIFRYISKPWEDHDMLLHVRHALERKRLAEEKRRLQALTERQNLELRELNANLEAKVKERTRELEEAMVRLEQAHAELKKSYTSSVKVFANLVEMRGGGVSGHSRRVAEMARNLARTLNMADSEVQSILFAGLLHDIGKIGLPDTLLSKPFNALPADERAKVATHSAVGQAVLMSLEPLQEASTFVRHHHERYDGRGFPDGLQGAAIPLGARILAVVNDYDALQAGSISTQRFSTAEAVEFLRTNRGKRYDPDIVDAFIALLGRADSDELAEEEICLKSSSLEPGMVLARDLTTRDGLLLLSKDYILDARLIHRIQNQEASLGTDLDVYIRKGKRAHG